jgi:hypothetical protein
MKPVAGCQIKDRVSKGQLHLHIALNFLKDERPTSNIERPTSKYKRPPQKTRLYSLSHIFLEPVRHNAVETLKRRFVCEVTIFDETRA